MQHLYKWACRNPKNILRSDLVRKHIITLQTPRYFVHNFTEKLQTIDQSTLAKRRMWPNQGDPKLESVTPPDSTTIFDISKGELIKDLFKGQLQLELFDYPEWETKQHVEDLDEIYLQIKKIILHFNSHELDETGLLTDYHLKRLKEFHLFGLQIPKSFNGLGLNRAQWCHICEAIALDSSLWATLTTHQTKSAKAIELYGTEDQKLNYLPVMATGQKIAAFCVSECSSGSDIQSISMQATHDLSTNEYTLNGEKSWVINGFIADVFVVFAKTPHLSTQTNDGIGDITAFIVDRSMDGIQCGPKLETCGIRGANINNVIFANVRVPTANVLGNVGCGSKIVRQIESYSHLDTSALAVGQMRYFLSYISEHCLQRHQFGRPIADYAIVRQKLAHISTNLYAIESGLFYLAQIWDAQPGRDLQLELAALKIFSTESLWSAINDCIDLTGCYGLLKQVPFERFIRDARTLMIDGSSNDILRIRLTDAGLNYIVPTVQETASKLQFPLYHPILYYKAYRKLRARRLGLTKSTVGAGIKVTEGNASTNLRDHVHPNFKTISDDLATYTLRFQSIAEMMLMTYGKNVVEEQMLLGRVANYAIDWLLLAICLGRASRSISIGIPANAFEFILVEAFAESAMRRMESVLKYPHNFDLTRYRIASELLAHRSYPVSHPSTRVW